MLVNVTLEEIIPFEARQKDLRRLIQSAFSHFHIKGLQDFSLDGLRLIFVNTASVLEFMMPCGRYVARESSDDPDRCVKLWRSYIVIKPYKVLCTLCWFRSISSKIC